MSELTNKRLEIIRERLRNEDPDGRPNLRTEATIEIIDELLTLRSLRDAGDEDFREKLEQVDDWIGKVPVAHLDSVFERDARIALSEMEKMYITRGQQLREAREEIERLKGEYASLESNWLHEKENVEWQKTKVRNLRMAADAAGRVDLQPQIATLTAERDQWKKQCESECQYGYLRQDELDAVKAELAVLKSCPAMAEVDAILNDTEKSSEQIESELADLARRSIASREEVVGMLSDTERLIKWMVKHWDWTGKLESIAEGCVIEPWKENARLVLEIVEGK